MPLLVDTNVVVDVLSCDPVWEARSDQQINLYRGELWINPLIYCELCFGASSTTEVDGVMRTLGLRYVELPPQALFLAAKAFRLYKQRGGHKTSALPDFFIGAHAEAAGFTVLTRDATRYRTYFPSVALVCPP